MKLEGMAGIKQLAFDLANRKLEVLHSGEVEPISAAIHDLNLDDTHTVTEQADAQQHIASERNERKLLIYVLIINAFFFVLEMLTGFLSHSMGLVADSLDMLADALVYSLSLFAVGGTIMRKKRIAKISGYFQLALALFGFSEVVRRFMGYGEMPVFSTMIYISFFALIGNAMSLIILRKAKSDEAHIKASWIFTSNDVIINIGVMLAGALVYFTSSRLPDLIIGTFVFAIVVQGAFRILKLSK
jgi:Co/Zn/Cd efflux system component